MPEPLAACPFCGSGVIEVWASDVGGTYATAVCRTCQACGPEGQDSAQAQTLWNTRRVPEGTDG